MTANLPASEILPKPFCAKPDIVRRFLAWAQSVDVDTRAEAASALARAYLYSEMTTTERAEAALGLMALLDDASIQVRQTLAEALCRANNAPRSLILALAADEPEASALVLQRSPMLTEADLVDCASNGDLAVQMSLAGRPRLPPRAAARLGDIGRRDAVLALVRNVEIELEAELLERILDRFCDDANLREALLGRASLPATVRARIAVAAARDLAVEASKWMAPSQAERVAHEARDQAICTIFSSCSPDERASLTRGLRAVGSLTPALLLRSLLGGERRLFAHALAELSNLPLSRVAAFILDPEGEGFAALARRAGLKGGLLPAFHAALAALKTDLSEESDRLKLPLVQKVIDECERRDDPALDKVRALLWRLAAEGARAEAANFAREAAGALAIAGLPPLLSFTPVNDDNKRALRLMGVSSTAQADALLLELPPTSLSEDQALRVELPADRISRLGEAA